MNWVHYIATSEMCIHNVLFSLSWVHYSLVSEWTWVLCGPVYELILRDKVSTVQYFPVWALALKRALGQKWLFSECVLKKMSQMSTGHRVKWNYECRGAHLGKYGMSTHAHLSPPSVPVHPLRKFKVAICNHRIEVTHFTCMSNLVTCKYRVDFVVIHDTECPS